MEQKYIQLNNELMQKKDGFYQLQKDREAVQAFLEEVESKMKRFETEAARLRWLIDENYYEDFFRLYELDDILSIRETVFSYEFKFQSFMAVSKFYKDYALKTNDHQQYLEYYEDRIVAVALYLAQGDAKKAMDYAVAMIEQRYQPATPTFLKRPLSYEIVVQFIYSFHMPLFFIVSGFLAVKSININFRNDYFLLLKKRIIKLGVPYVVIALITNIALNIASGNITINGFIESIKTTIFYPELGAMGALWFLYALLIISILTPIITKISLEASIIITIIINIFGPRDLYFLAINRISFFIVYYLIGMYVRKCYEDKKLKNINNKNIIIIGSVIFLGIYSLIISKGIVINRIIFNLYMFLCGLVGSLMMLLII